MTDFSYVHIATELGITKAGLHYHYPGKAEARPGADHPYTQRSYEALADIDRDAPDARAKLEAYVNLYAGVLRNERMCMCATSSPRVPDPAGRDAIAGDRLLRREPALARRTCLGGRRRRNAQVHRPPEDVAQGILSTLEGAMLVARPYGDIARFDAAASQLLAGLTT